MGRERQREASALGEGGREAARWRREREGGTALGEGEGGRASAHGEGEGKK